MTGFPALFMSPQVRLAELYATRVRMTREQMVARMLGHGWKVWFETFEGDPRECVVATGSHFVGRLRMPLPMVWEEHDVPMQAIYAMLMAHLVDVLHLRGTA